ncbi:MAG: hypothetical protein HLUCCA12_01440 [Rhodobacteraceae bacterium HLUCCA12]|nr:MAG: hypothetical protein HLUCCA12_01440 [Rhodobacteraceae bacterium HLUCCA12]
MAYISRTDLSADIRAQIDRLFAGIGQGFNAYLEARSRAGEIDYLNGLSDAELAKRGITRDRIAYHVFRDRFGS